MKFRKKGPYENQVRAGVHLEGAEAQEFANNLLMEITGTQSMEEAREIFLGRPTLEREKSKSKDKTTQVQLRIPQSWKKRIDVAAKKQGSTRSAYLRDIIRTAIFPS